MSEKCEHGMHNCPNCFWRNISQLNFSVIGVSYSTFVSTKIVATLCVSSGCICSKKEDGFTMCHNVLRIGMKRTSISGLLHVVKGLSGSIFPCQLHLKHSKWQIYYKLIFLNQCHNFIHSWWVHVTLRLLYIINMYFWLKIVIWHLVCRIEIQFYTN